MFLNVWTTSLRPPALKKLETPAQDILEWLYDRDAPQDIFGKRPGS